jgi:hypothetical protein
VVLAVLEALATTITMTSKDKPTTITTVKVSGKVITTAK